MPSHDGPSSAPAMADRMQAACAAIAHAPNPSPLEIEQAIRAASDRIRAAVVTDATLPAATPILATLARRIGDIDQVPSLQLQMLRGALAHRSGDAAPLVEARAFALALLTQIERSGDGKAPATAWHPCLIGNEYAFVARALQARVAGQALVQENGRHYDRLTLALADGSECDVFFDITEVFQRNAATLTP